jgi:glycosyltransferase involved in cell wall biosynthesis
MQRSRQSVAIGESRRVPVGNVRAPEEWRGVTERILYLLNSFEPDAPNRLMLAIAEAARESGHYECLVVACSRSGSLREDMERRAGPAVCLSLRGLTQLSALKKIRQVIADYRPSIVHATLARPTILGVPVAHTCGVPHIVITQHGTHEWREGGYFVAPFVPWLFRGAVARASVVVAVSESVRRDLMAAGLAPKKIVTIHNGVNTSQFVPLGRDQQVCMKRELFPADEPDKVMLVGAAGNLRRIKGHRVLVGAASMVLAKHPEARFVVWGEGPERESLGRLIGLHGISEAFVLPGLRQDIGKAMAACDVFVQPSLEESFGLAAAEAMCCGVALVASAVGGLCELVEDGRSGLLFEPGNADALAEQVSRVLDDPAEGAALGGRGRERILAFFDVERMKYDYMALYSSLAGSGVRE